MGTSVWRRPKANTKRCTTGFRDLVHARRRQGTLSGSWWWVGTRLDLLHCGLWFGSCSFCRAVFIPLQRARAVSAGRSVCRLQPPTAGSISVRKNITDAKNRRRGTSTKIETVLYFIRSEDEYRMFQ